MHVYTVDQWSYFVNCLCLGLLSGFIYDEMCILPSKCIQKYKHNFFKDLVFVLIFFSLYFLMTYSINFGMYRAYALLGCLASMNIYRITIGIPILKISVAIHCRIAKILLYVFNKLKLALDISVKFVTINYENLIIKLYIRKVYKDLRIIFSGKVNMINKTPVKRKEKAKVNRAVKFVLATVFLFLMIMSVFINVSINKYKAEFEKIQIEYDQRKFSLEQIKSDLSKLPENIEDLDEETLKKIAREELNLRESDVIIYANSQPN